MSVANSRHLVLARIKTPKKSYKISESAVSDTLLKSGFQNFAAHVAFLNRALRDVFNLPNQKKCPIIPKFLPAILLAKESVETWLCSPAAVLKTITVLTSVVPWHACHQRTITRLSALETSRPS